MSAPVVSLLGIEFNNVSRETVTRHLLARPAAAPFAYIVTPNADHIDRLRRIPRLRGVYRRAMLRLLDSRLLFLFAKALHLAKPTVITGADLTESLLPLLGGRRVAVVGMRNKDFVALASRYKAVEFIRHDPPMGLLYDHEGFAAAMDFIRTAQAPFTFLALGSPVQELLAYAVAARGDAVGVGLCVGAALEFAAGTARRAPPWMRNYGLEWLHRLAGDPWRLTGRYLIANPRVFIALAVAAFERKMR
jgi:exopolysaccharide biosynthesis WecB/TagA/CpsF family protein